MKKVCLSLVLALLLVLTLGCALATGSVESPTKVSLNDLTEGELSKTNLNDYYGLTLKKSGLVSLRFASQATHNRFTLYDEDGYQLWTGAYDWNSEAGQSNQVVNLYLTSGSYVLAVTPDSSVESANVRAYGTYEFTPVFTSAGETRGVYSHGSFDN